MKKFALSAIVAVAALASNAALAADLTYNVGASVSSVCGAYRSSGSTINVPFNDLAVVDSGTSVPVSGGSATYRCNSAAGFTRTISSLGGGKLVRAGSNADVYNSIPYTVAHGGGSGLGFSATPLASSIITTLGGSSAFLSGQTGSVNFNVNGVSNINTNANNAPGTTVFAGAYSDVVTIAISAL